MAKKDEFVIDSSVVAKWFLIEADSDRAIRLRDQFATGRIRLAVPTLIFYEVMNALRFGGSFDEEDLTLASRSLSKYQFEIWRPKGRLLELSARFSLQKDVTIYDACYVALAQRIGSRVITEDKELIEKFPALTMPMSLSDEMSDESGNDRRVRRPSLLTEKRAS